MPAQNKYIHGAIHIPLNDPEQFIVFKGFLMVNSRNAGNVGVKQMWRGFRDYRESKSVGMWQLEYKNRRKKISL